ncbi:MAG TPA: cupin domain-containing protein [Ramlibacter sp.]|nr:cupin domain-containing protein [Ramlibacter sp.]
MRPTVISTAQLAAYSPANHTGTSNVRVIGPETVGATALEVLVGTIARSHGAKPHAHPFLEQCAYMLEGTGESQAQGRTDAIPQGSWGYVPAGVFHTFRVTSDEPGRVLVVYTPPYGENPAQTITVPDAAVAEAGDVRVLATPAAGGTALVPLIDAHTAGARWVEVDAMDLAAGESLTCAARADAEQVLFLEDGQLLARADGTDLKLAAGDFLFLPRGVSAQLRCAERQRASGFLIKGLIPHFPTPPSKDTP